MLSKTSPDLDSEQPAPKELLRVGLVPAQMKGEHGLLSECLRQKFQRLKPELKGRVLYRPMSQ